MTRKNGILSLSARDSARLNRQILSKLIRWVLKNEQHRPIAEIREDIARLRVWGDMPLADDELDITWAVRTALGYPWFDCRLIAASVARGCRYFLTEDMAHGATFETVTLINPFRMSPDELLLRN
ncbi:PIN domain-containing protein [Methylobacterium haplocladii]|uniref:PIN domain-containing protein n=1 Tax=Methylobacterium haplocladii TaxID=1176176 RepID=A0A512IJW7_9HYPH|nr:PIN domain-containing protein [Methylobacterium haplocladii]GEO97971.1 hypothetical protein MHA02_03590 [Methylobacterium haplocladii]GJD86022.1 hypothetical protein HPGCJGGD_3919 [Methylobacterium haplocladii]GLS57872.1 hypothetical protein GCM10007887_05280 [Methylobacterium haplocladii]